MNPVDLQLTRGLIGVVVATTVLVPAWAAPRVVTPSEQAERDSERLRVLQDELAHETRAVEDSTRRKAERLAAGDAKGVEESEQAILRSTQNLTALRQEIDRDRSRRVPTTPIPPAGSGPLHTSAARDASGATVWWDVYRQAPRPNELIVGNGRMADGAPVVSNPNER